MDLSAYNLPASVEGMIELSPMEDIALALLRHYLPDLKIYSLIPEEVQEDAFVLVRRSFPFGEWQGDERGFLDSARLDIHVYAQDPYGDTRGALIAEAVRKAFAMARKDKFHVPGRGWVHRTKMLGEPSRKSDWATSAGPVQYADLPDGFWRYEARFLIVVRPEL